MPVIIFDSYDCTGKTLYAKAISDLTGFPNPKNFVYEKASHANPVFGDDPERYAFWSRAQHFALTRIFTGASVNMVMDRGIMSEYCYSPVLRGYNIEDYYWAIDAAFAQSKNVLWVYTSVGGPDFKEVITSRFKKKGEKYVTYEETLRIKKNFDRLFEKSSIPRIRINTTIATSEVLEDNTNRILRALREMRNNTGDSKLISLIRGPLGVARESVKRIKSSKGAKC